MKKKGCARFLNQLHESGMEILRNVTVLHWLVCDCMLSKIMSDHAGFHFNKHETSSVVASDLRADEVGKDGHVSEVGFDDLGLDSLYIGAGFDGFLNFLQEVSVRALQSTLEATAHARRE